MLIPKLKKLLSKLAFFFKLFKNSMKLFILAVFVNLNTLEKTAMCDWKIGETLLLSGKILTARDAVHKKLEQLLDNKEPLPNNIDLTNKFILHMLKKYT